MGMLVNIFVIGLVVQLGTCTDVLGGLFNLGRGAGDGSGNKPKVNGGDIAGGVLNIVGGSLKKDNPNLLTDIGGGVDGILKGAGVNLNLKAKVFSNVQGIVDASKANTPPDVKLAGILSNVGGIVGSWTEKNPKVKAIVDGIFGGVNRIVAGATKNKDPKVIANEVFGGVTDIVMASLPKDSPAAATVAKIMAGVNTIINAGLSGGTQEAILKQIDAGVKQIVDAGSAAAAAAPAKG